jgi:tRNA A37 methylthiotransferase MiaB
MDALPDPDRSQVDDRYYRESGIDSLQTKRGCPLRCDYCTYPTIEGRVGRVREPARVAAEFERIRGTRSEAQHVFVVDSVFNLPLGHAKSVCRELIAGGAALPWTCYANPLGFDAELAELMARAGCAGMEVGSDSGSDATLGRLRKGFTTKHIRRLHDLAVSAGIPDCHTFILGTPDEDLDEVRRTLEFIVDLDPFSVIIMVWTDDSEALHPELAVQRRHLRDAVLEILDDHKHEFPWWSIPELGVNHDRRLFRLLRRRGLQGPLWQHSRTLIDQQPAERRRRRQSPIRKNGAKPIA